jgi:hypothetical protein
MPDITFTHMEIMAEYEALGFKYPQDMDFTEEEIALALRELRRCARHEHIAILNGSTHRPGTVAAFANLAGSLSGVDIIIESDCLIIVRDTTPETRRVLALAHLKEDREDDQKQAARTSLRERFKKPKLEAQTS